MSKEQQVAEAAPANFIKDIVQSDVAAHKHGGQVVTRFPPEPNGYLHIGHAYAASVSYNIARAFGGRFHLRFDDTNPSTEESAYAEAQERDLRWLGVDWGGHIYHASDYFEQMYEHALTLIKAGKAYVCELPKDQISEYRGSHLVVGKNSPYRDRSVEDNLAMFERMKSGELPAGAAVLRAKIDMAAPNLVMRDPVMYRIQHVPHFRTGSKWHIYPMYDWAHCLEDSIEKVTHSLCSLEFENNRALYDWYLDQLGLHHPQQIEFSRMNLSHTVMSKRKLIELVRQGLVDAWDDPRMPTVAGLRRRGVTPEALRDFLARLGVSKSPTNVDVSLFEYFLREDLNTRCARRMAVLRPLRVVIDNYPDDQVEWFDADNNPEDPAAGTRKIAFSKVLYIEQDDFMVDPPKKYFRLFPGGEIRLKHAYYIKCIDYTVDDASGEVSEVRCTYDPESRGGTTEDGRKVRGTSHWVSEAHSVTAELRLYDRLFSQEHPDDVLEGGSLTDQLNPDSLQILTDCRLEASLADVTAGDTFQFLRQGYFCVDSRDSKPTGLVFNRAVALRDSWTKKAAR